MQDISGSLHHKHSVRIKKGSKGQIQDQDEKRNYNADDEIAKAALLVRAI